MINELLTIKHIYIYVYICLKKQISKLSQHQDMLGRWDLEAVVSTFQPLAAAVFFIWSGNIMKSTHR